ncbi:hypothetical protein A4X09_0g5875 [Tilletia walkeri]|uniref:Poly(A) RNA polymerase mitochondrial-like central palm domain-containing protein n=1 Tax=Tilletia walkeri TaxID=117179 RepID=A0A8X7T2G3_9BASI|nr:hypothetical protein A4X09_0g5875 [Tilletia walkeri]
MQVSDARYALHYAYRVRQGLKLHEQAVQYKDTYLGAWTLPTERDSDEPAPDPVNSDRAASSGQQLYVPAPAVSSSFAQQLPSSSKVASSSRKPQRPSSLAPSKRPTQPQLEPLPLPAVQQVRDDPALSDRFAWQLLLPQISQQESTANEGGPSFWEQRRLKKQQQQKPVAGVKRSLEQVKLDKTEVERSYEEFTRDDGGAARKRQQYTHHRITGATAPKYLCFGCRATALATPSSDLDIHVGLPVTVPEDASQQDKRRLLIRNLRDMGKFFRPLADMGKITPIPSFRAPLVRLSTSEHLGCIAVDISFGGDDGVTSSAISQMLCCKWPDTLALTTVLKALLHSLGFGGGKKQSLGRYAITLLCAAWAKEQHHKRLDIGSLFMGILDYITNHDSKSNMVTVRFHHPDMPRVPDGSSLVLIEDPVTGKNAAHAVIKWSDIKAKLRRARDQLQAILSDPRPQSSILSAVITIKDEEMERWRRIEQLGSDWEQKRAPRVR